MDHANNKKIQALLPAVLVLFMCLLAGCGGTDVLPGTEITDAPGAQTQNTEVSDMTEENNKYRTASGQPYTVTGLQQSPYPGFTFSKDGGVIELTPANCVFNCFSISYSAADPFVCEAEYVVGGKTVKDTFRLEKGNDAVFTSLTEGYTSGLTAENLTSITIRPCMKTNAFFTLNDITYSMREKCPGREVCISDGRIKLGVHLEWGGGISLYEDLNDGDPTVSNLLNSHDTGRLVQQSYYGTGSAPYVPSEYNGTTWNYNPVQGGNQYNQKSRLIDFRVDEAEKSIYVKCLPRDWAKKDTYTMSYMENTYRIMDGYVRVDNRFVDFSGYSHPVCDQELPAFYTISYLGNFTFYDGTAAWTGDALTTLADEPFWAGRGEAYHPVKSAENWCAWTSDSGFGIGVFTPDATTLLAGRFSYNGSKSASDGATNYVAPLIKMKLETYKAFEYTYYIASGTLGEIRGTFEGLK